MSYRFRKVTNGKEWYVTECLPLVMILPGPETDTLISPCTPKMEHTFFSPSSETRSMFFSSLCCLGLVPSKPFFYHVMIIQRQHMTWYTSGHGHAYTTRNCLPGRCHMCQNMRWYPLPTSGSVHSSLHHESQTPFFNTTLSKRHSHRSADGGVDHLYHPPS